MPQNEYLLISRGQWDESASKEAVQGAIDRFYTWYEQGLSQGKLKRGSRLENRGKLVSKAGITDGPFAEAKELVGGYWFVVAGTLEDAAAIAPENPCLEFGLMLEVRPLEAARANASSVTNETPPAWRAGEA
ncbi:YciI family protein [Piscinibacter defluvii]|uniref:YciI family protein n=1 Tax=Piscinibacter defluvii TaxID=1796922 RepID=UPI000FDF04E4|nr:YciI family protein [Piscinibacter defluvii]